MMQFWHESSNQILVNISLVAKNPLSNEYIPSMYTIFYPFTSFIYAKIDQNHHFFKFQTSAQWDQIAKKVPFKKKF